MDKVQTLNEEPLKLNCNISQHRTGSANLLKLKE